MHVRIGRGRNKPSVILTCANQQAKGLMQNTCASGRCGNCAHMEGPQVKGGVTAVMSNCSNYRPLTLLPVSTSCMPSSSRSALHVLCVCTTSSMHFALAEEHSSRCRTCWRLCGNAPRLTRPRMPTFSMPQKYMTQYRALYYSTASFSAAWWVQSLPFWWPCTRRHPAGCVSGRPCLLPLWCNVGLRKGAHCPRCCMQSS